MTGPSAHVLDLFAVPDVVRALPGGGSVVAGDLVLSPGRDPATAEWLNPPLARLAVSLDERAGRRPWDLRIAVPVPARDGSWVVDGWGATRYEPGSVGCTDLDVLIAVGRALHAELAVAFPARPAGLESRTDRWAVAERLAFAATDELVARCPDDPVIARVAALLAGEEPEPVAGAARPQLVHADLAGNVLLGAGGAPVVIDVSPAWRPPLWAEAVSIVDAVADGTAPVTEVLRLSGSEGRRAVARAVAFRQLSDLSPGDRYLPLLDRLTGPPRPVG